MMRRLSDDQQWMLASAGSAAVAGIITRVAARSGARKLTGKKAPYNPAAADTSWRQAVLFAVGTGVAVGLVRVLTHRASAGAWRRLTGHTPGRLRG